MKRINVITFSLFPIFILMGISLKAQVTYISPFTSSDDGGNGLFANCLPEGVNMYINWNTFVDPAQCGGVGSATNGTAAGSSCKVVVRGTSPSPDGSSVIASDVVCEASGIYDNNDIGSNDAYFANLNICNLSPGRYSVEIHCDCMGGDYDNATGDPTAATTWDYAPPESPTYYYGGTAGACGAEDGLDEFSVNGDGTGGWREKDDICSCESAQLDYFTIGDAGVYRSMVVINGLFMDMGKFQPGNPTLPTALNDLQNMYDPGCVGIGGFPTAGFCAGDALTLDGAEVNVFKNVGCGTADITGNRLCYQIYETGMAAPGFTCINIPFTDDCPAGYQGENTFPNGGSCMNQGCALDQRWQSQSFGVDLLAMAPTAGNYTVDFYTETDIVDCSGTASTVTEPATGAYTTSFDRLDDASAACGACGANPGVWNN